jgi:CRP-like cAMP-binding protein
VIPGYSIEGHAIVSRDDRIAGADGVTPPSLRNHADWARFQKALDASVAVLLGRRGHFANPNTHRRNRIVVSAAARGIERRADGWWWNPGEISLREALGAAAPAGGTVAVPGGRLVFDLFLRLGFDAFHLARSLHVNIPDGVPIFSAVKAGQSAESLLRQAGLLAGGVEMLDAAAGVTLTVWRRPFLREITEIVNMEPQDFLKTIPFFGEVLDDDEIARLAARAHFVDFQEGATPIEEGGPGQAMYVIVSGEALVTIADDPKPVATLGRGDIVGEMSLLTGARRSATVTAKTALEVIEISKQALAHVLEHSPDLVDRFAALLERRQRQLDRIAGGNAWGMLHPGKAEMASTIRAFFRKVP